MLEHYILKLASKRYDIDCFIIESLPHHFMKKNFKLFPTVFCSESLILIFTRNALYLWVACFNFMSRRSNLQIGEQNNCILSTTFLEEKLKKKFSAVALKNLQIDGNTQFNSVPPFQKKTPKYKNMLHGRITILHAHILRLMRVMDTFSLNGKNWETTVIRTLRPPHRAQSHWTSLHLSW